MPEKRTTGNSKNIVDSDFCDRVRKRLKIKKKKDLPDSVIKNVCKLNCSLIGDWIVENQDGFKIKDNGILIVSKWMPKHLRGEKQEKIQEILNNPNNDEYLKDRYLKRYQKIRKSFEGGKIVPKIDPMSFFYFYRVMWFNSMNCKFDKAEIFEFKVARDISQKLKDKILQGNDFYEWQFSDFRITREKEAQEKKFLKLRKANGKRV